LIFFTCNKFITQDKLGFDLQAPSANAVFKRKTPFPAANIQIFKYQFIVLITEILIANQH